MIKSQETEKAGEKMPAFFQDIEVFRGDGSRNEKGETLEEFLENYDPYRYKNPCCTVDMAVFGYSGKDPENLEDLRILLIRRKNHPSIGDWALPGGFIELKEDLEVSAKRELFEETNIRNVCAEQIGVFGEVRRDPRARVITTAFMSLVCLDEVEAKAGDDASDAAWFTITMNRQKEEEKIRYQIELQNEQNGVILRPELTVLTNGTLIREQRIEIKNRGGLASDHASILLLACRKLCDRMKCAARE